MFKDGNWVKGVPAVAGIVATLVLVGALLWVEPGELNWAKAIGLVFIAGFVFILVGTMRFALGGLAEPPPPPMGEDGQVVIRSRLAPLVFITGTVGIVVVAIAVIVAVMQTDPAAGAETYMGILSTIVPVLATWVGSVIAFYFSNESFRQAAAASGALSDPALTEPVTNRMFPVEKVTGLTLGGTSKEKPVPAELHAIDMVQLVYPLFGETVSRVIVFDKDKRVVAIIRAKLAGATGTYAMVKDYLDADQHLADSLNFQAVPEQATVAQARSVLETYRTSDIFVTQNGQLSEPVKGWLPDDRLK